MRSDTFTLGILADICAALCAYVRKNGPLWCGSRPGTLPGTADEAKSGFNPALSRNCDAPPGDEPGRLRSE